MTESEYRERQIADARKGFSEHAALYALHADMFGDNIEFLQFKRAHTWVYGMRLIRHSHWLTVLGDCGEAVYQWSEPVSLEWIAGCDLAYIYGKIRARPEGWEHWHHDVASSHIIQSFEDDEDHDGLKRFLASSGVDALHTASDWHEWIATREAQKILGDDCYEQARVGYVMAPQHIRTMIGLKAAIDLLKQNGHALAQKVPR